MGVITDMREVCQQRRPNSKGKMVWAGHWFNRFVTRWFSIYFTWLFVKLRISANMVTFLMIITGIAGTALVIPHILWLNVIGMVLILLTETLDCVDGEVARWTQKSSLKGLYLDLVSHVLCNAPASAICGLHLYVFTKQEKYLILAFIAYAMAQCRLALKEEFNIVALQMQNSGEVKPLNTNDSTRDDGYLKTALRVVKWALHMSVDEFIIRFACFGVIFLLYMGYMLPMIVLAWWFVIFGIVVNLGEIANKYFVVIPHSKHTKKV